MLWVVKLPCLRGWCGWRMRGDFATRYFSVTAAGNVQFATELVLTLLLFLKPRCVSWRYGAVTDGAQVFDDSVLLLRRQQDDAKSWFGDWSAALTQFCFQLAYPFFRLLAQLTLGVGALALGIQAWDVVLGAGVVPVQPSLPPAEVQPQGFAVSPQFSVG